MTSDLTSESWGSRVWAWRDGKGLTQGQFVKLLHDKGAESASPSLVSNWEHDKQAPTRRYAKLVQEITGIEYDAAAEARRTRETGRRLADLERRIELVEAATGLGPDAVRRAAEARAEAQARREIAESEEADPAEEAPAPPDDGQADHDDLEDGEQPGQAAG